MNTATDAPTQGGAEHGPQQTAAVWMQRWPAHPLGVLVLLAALATLSYSNTFSARFYLDDLPNIVENRQIRDLSVVREVSGSRYIGFLSFALNYYVGGLQVAGYHVVNLLIHLTNGFMVYTLVGLLGRTPGLGAGPGSPSPAQANGVALITALVFVVHPIQTQAVTYIVQRFTSLATLFYLLAVVCYLHWRLATSPRPAGWWYAGALGATILAMKTKEISFTLPFLLLLVEGVGFGRPSGKRWGPLLPFGLTLLIIPLSLPGGLGETEAGFARETADISRLSYLFTQGRAIVTYLRLLIWPVHQNLDYDYPVYDSLLAPPVFLSYVGLLCLLGLAAYLLLVGSARWKLVGFGLGWFFLTLAVESSLIPIRDVLVEHRLYLPSVGFFLAGSAVAANLLARWRMLALALGVGVILLFAVATYQRNRVWHDAVSLWSDVVTRSPTKARGHLNLGNAYARRGRLNEAILEFMTARRLKPDLPEAPYNLGNIYARQGRWEEAIQEFSVAVHLKSDYSKAHNNLGDAYARQGRLDEAIQEFMTALRLQPDLPEAHNNLGRAYFQQGRLNEAIAELMATIQIKPDSPFAHLDLGDVYAAQGRSEDAIQAYRTALRLKPTAPDAHNNLGILYARHGRLAEAMAEFAAAVQLQPEFPEAHYNLGSAYARQGRLDEAIPEYLTALRLKPGFPEVHYDLGNAYQLKGLTREARRHFELAVRLQPDFTPAQHALEVLDRSPQALR